MKISASLIMKAVSLLWTLGYALKDGKLSEDELQEIEQKLSALVGALEGIL